MSRGAPILGYAWRTPLGATVEEGVRRLLAGERAARQNDRFPVDTYACRLAAPIAGAPGPSADRRFLGRLGLFGAEVAREALALATERSPGPRAPERLGLFCAVGGLRVRWDDLLPALAGQQADGADAWNRGFRQLHPFWLLKHLSNNAHARISIALRALGEGATFAGALAGAEAIAAATRALAAGAVDRALVVAYDSWIEPEILIDLAARGVASHATAEGLSAPYDEAAAGVVPGEAAAALVLGREDEGALGWIAAASSADGSLGEPSAALLAEIAGRLLDRGPAGVVDGAARALPGDDAEERDTVGAVVGPDLPLLASPAAMASTGAAAPLVRAIALAEVLRRGVLPPIAGLRRAAPGPLRPLRAAERTEARAGIALFTGAPGLSGGIRVEVA
jgi:3-oxoacyl-(acyl-carrier-protein) synthase